MECSSYNGSCKAWSSRDCVNLLSSDELISERKIGVASRCVVGDRFTFGSFNSNLIRDLPAFEEMLSSMRTERVDWCFVNKST